MLQIARVDQSETIELLVKNINTKEYKFGDNETTLDKIVLHGIACHTEALGKSPATGATLLTNAQLKKGYLSISNSANKLSIKRIPLETFFNADSLITYIEPRIVDVRKSFVTFPDSPTFVLPVDGLGLAAVFTFFYEKFDAVKHAHLAADDKA